MRTHKFDNFFKKISNKDKIDSYNTMTDSPLPPAALFRRKKEHRRGITYTLLLLGKSGTGTTTFANNLLESNIFPHKYRQLGSNNSDSENRYNVSSKITITKPTKVVSFNSKNGIPSLMADFEPAQSHLEPGITMTSTSVEISTTSEDGEQYIEEDEDSILLNLINVHGLGENLDDSICFEEITSYLEQQFDIVLAEETRIRRNPRFEDTRVHVALYFIEPNGHGLNELDIELMKRVSRYTNVLPIISKADTLTKDELKSFRMNILNDIERFNVPVYKFEIDPDDDDLEAIEENQALAQLQPFAVVCSDIKNNKGNYIREYPWGTVEIDNDKISDLLLLKNVLFGSHLQEFKDTTQNLLYENYRAEKLSSVTSVTGRAGSLSTEEEEQEDTIDKRASAVPSLSNFTSLINTGHFKSNQSLALTSQLPSTPNLSVKQEPIEESPIKQMSNEIKSENEEIIKSIKKEAQSPDLRERHKLRNISETVPYVLRHERIIARQQKLEELEAQSAKELQKRIQELEKKAHDLKLRERLLKSSRINSSSASINSSSSIPHSVSHSQLKKGDTYTDLASIVSGKD